MFYANKEEIKFTLQNCTGTADLRIFQMTTSSGDLEVSQIEGLRSGVYRVVPEVVRCIQNE